MALSLDAFAEASRPKRMQCSVAKIGGALEAKDAAVLAEALANPDVTNTAVASVLTAAGHKIAPCTVSRHRKGECACGG